MDDSTVEYRVYIRDILTSGTGQLETVLESRLVEYLAFFSPLIGDYIWQNQAFNLTSVKSESPPCLMGRVDFGDSVDDEWFIVYLLTQLSIKYPDVCISVHDSDGEFLLIEAAHVIPKWLKPESSKNRVFIQGGNVHIIPLPSSPGEITIFPTGWPALIISLQLVFGPHETAAAQEIQQAIKQRLDRFPDAVQEMFHHANLYVPPGVKYLLERNLALVSQAVNAFYHRDPRDMKACRQMKYFPPDQTVRTRVRFTKCLYAQLAQRQFLPDRASSWKLPPASHPHHGNHALGYKLTCGFEILCSKASSDCKQAIPSGPRWERYLNCLLNQGYFKGEVDGSQGYNNLLQSARIHFQESCATDESFDTNNWSRGSNSDVGSTILAMLDGADIDVEQMKREESQLPPEDDDSWLDVSPEQLDALLMSYRNTQQTADPASSHQEAQDTQIDAGFDLDHVTRSMNAFVENVSSYEGAEFPSETETDEVRLDADSFMDTMRRLLERAEEIRDPKGNQDNEEEDDDDEDDDDDDVDTDVVQYMHGMDEELAATHIAESFQKEKPISPNFDQRSSVPDECSADDVTSDDSPVDVDLNLVQNLLESVASQQGLAGPASNILSSMGIRLPADETS